MTELIRVHGYDVVLDKTKCHAIKKSDGFQCTITKVKGSDYCRQHKEMIECEQ